jgi:galactokinase
MPAAISFNTLVAATSRTDTLLRLHSVDFAEFAEVDLRQLHVPARDAPTRWNFYCEGVAWSLLQHLGAHAASLSHADQTLTGADLTITGNVPQGAGLSSSASIEVAVATALLALSGKTLRKPTVALACQRAENAYVHGSCGIMDQFISACGVRDNALAIDTRALTSELAPIPHSLRLVVSNSMVTHQVAGESPYAQRRREVEEAATVCGRQLRDVSLDQLFAVRDKMSNAAFLRARHVITDSQRVHDGVAALQHGDAAAFGRLMLDAHASFRDDFEASCDECNLLVRLAMTLEGCLGSRLTGGGFGGCTVSLVEEAAAPGFAKELGRLYRADTGVEPQIFICEIADGAGEMHADRN